MDEAKSFAKKLPMAVLTVIAAFVVIRLIAKGVDMVAPGKGDTVRGLVAA